MIANIYKVFQIVYNLSFNILFNNPIQNSFNLGIL